MRRTALVAVFCLLAGPLYAQDRATFEKLSEAFAETFNKGDVASLASEGEALFSSSGKMQWGRSVT